MKTKNQESAEKIKTLTFDQVKKVTLKEVNSKYNLCKVLSMC